MKKKSSIGSSETTREASVFHFDTVLFKTTPKSSGIENQATFFEWFIGFTEGDGSFIRAKFATKKNLNNTRPRFIINQKDPKVLYKIKKGLGFGVVSYIQASENHNAYFRYKVDRLSHIEWLIRFFNGNLLLTKVQERFVAWVECFNDLYFSKEARQDLNMPLQIEDLYARAPSLPLLCPFGATGNRQTQAQAQIYDLCVDLCFKQKNFVPIQVKAFYKEAAHRVSLDSGWLAGFIDAEGGFYGSLSKNKRFKTGYRERWKFHIAQKHEAWLLQRIGEMFEEAAWKKLGFISKPASWGKKKHVCDISKKPNLHRLEIHREESLKILIDYFDRYPLLSKQSLVFMRWKRAFLYKDKHRKIALESEKGMRRYIRIFDSIGVIRNIVQSAEIE